MKNNFSLFLAGCSMLVLSGCGASDIASTGSGNVTINNGSGGSSGGGSSGGSGGGTVTAAAGCPTISDPQGLSDQGTITGPTGTWRVCRLPATIRTSTTLPKVAGLLYEISDRVNVGCDGGFTAPTVGAPYTSTTAGCTTPLTADTNVTLTIQPGVILFGGTGQSWLMVNRGNRINAVGNQTQPIIFTSRDNILGLSDDTSQGQWGGVVLAGRGRITDCRFGSVVSNTCERDTEGAANPGIYGGTDDTYNAGTMRYIQIRYSGFNLSPNAELQGLTTEGIGSGTTLEYIQSHNSSDDGAEFFGGVVNMKYYVATGADDDSLDVDVGARMDLQYALLVQRPGLGDGLWEIDSNGNEGDTPRTQLRVANMVAIQPQTSSNNEASARASIFTRGNSDSTLLNSIIISPNNECLRVNGSGTAPATFTARSVVMQCNATKYLGTGTYTAAQVQAFFGSGANNNNDAFTPTLTSLFINGANEDGVAAFDLTTVSPASTLLTNPSPNRIGAAWSGNTNWYTGWTCNSTTANFGSASTACNSLPTS
ncbi:hypothetical protein [Sphingobium sp. CHR27]|uniref:Secreted protein n=1 Tax=Sphingobium fluviale TaxID=2506423 RepID=A0A4Q1KGY2_9SPHN|nr:hypothetical protein EQG66_09370 [Sphingobium fluviale]